MHKTVFFCSDRNLLRTVRIPNSWVLPRSWRTSTSTGCPEPETPNRKSFGIGRRDRTCHPSKIYFLKTYKTVFVFTDENSRNTSPLKKMYFKWKLKSFKQIKNWEYRIFYSHWQLCLYHTVSSLNYFQPRLICQVFLKVCALTIYIEKFEKFLEWLNHFFDFQRLEVSKQRTEPECLHRISDDVSDLPSGQVSSLLPTATATFWR